MCAVRAGILFSIQNIKMRFYLCFICVQALAAEEEGKGGGRQQEAVVNCSVPGIT